MHVIYPVIKHYVAFFNRYEIILIAQYTKLVLYLTPWRFYVLKK
jgi:hypothetical protein